MFGCFRTHCCPEADKLGQLPVEWKYYFKLLFSVDNEKKNMCSRPRVAENQIH